MVFVADTCSVAISVEVFVVENCSVAISITVVGGVDVAVLDSVGNDFSVISSFPSLSSKKLCKPLSLISKTTQNVKSVDNRDSLKSCDPASQIRGVGLPFHQLNPKYKF